MKGHLWVSGWEAEKNRGDIYRNGKVETKFTAEWVNLNGEDVFGFKQMESKLAASHASRPSILISS